MCGHNFHFLLTLRATAVRDRKEREGHSRLPGNSNWPRVSHHLPLSPNYPLNKSSLVEPPPTFVPFQRGRVTTTAAGLNLGRWSDAGISVSKQPRLTIHPSGGERDFLACPKRSWLRGFKSLPFKDSLIFDQRPTEAMFATCVTFGSNRCPSKTHEWLEKPSVWSYLEQKQGPTIETPKQRSALKQYRLSHDLIYANKSII